MTTPPEERVTRESLSSALSPKSISVPDVQWHAITADELKAVVKVPKPIQASIALFAAGVILPTFVQAWPAIKAVAAGQPAEEGVGYFGLLVAAVVVTVICGINAVRGKTEADLRVEQIQERKTMIPLRSD